MDHPLDELKQRHRKLIYHFGEQLYGLRKSGQIDFAFSSSSSAQSKEISKLIKLLDYMEERIRKFEDFGTRGVEREEQPAASPANEDVCEPAKGQAEPVDEVKPQEEEIPAAEEKAEVLPSPEPEAEDAFPEETPESIPEPMGHEEATEVEVPEAAGSEESVAEETLPTASYEEIWKHAPEAVFEPLPVESSETEVAGTSDVETSVEQSGSETLETAYQSVEEASAQEPSPATVTFQDIRASAQFKSETEKSLFEDNLDTLLIGDAPARTRALKNLSYLGGKEAFQNVCKLSMKDPSAEIRMAALKAAGRTRQPGNAELYRTGLKDEDGSVRIASIKGLSMLLLNESTSSLLPLLRDPDGHVRSIAATCLGIYGGTQGVQAASELWSDPDAYVRKSLVDMLAVVRAPGSLAVVKQLLDDQDEGVRQAAKNALSKVKSVEIKGK